MNVLLYTLADMAVGLFAAFVLAGLVFVIAEAVIRIRQRGNRHE